MILPLWNSFLISSILETVETLLRNSFRTEDANIKVAKANITIDPKYNQLTVLLMKNESLFPNDNNRVPAYTEKSHNDIDWIPFCTALTVLIWF